MLSIDVELNSFYIIELEGNNETQLQRYISQLIPGTDAQGRIKVFVGPRHFTF